ncbi:hypothetical protein D3C77_468230 [compost metagenome]
MIILNCRLQQPQHPFDTLPLVRERLASIGSPIRLMRWFGLTCLTQQSTVDLVGIVQQYADSLLRTHRWLLIRRQVGFRVYQGPLDFLQLLIDSNMVGDINEFSGENHAVCALLLGSLVDFVEAHQVLFGLHQGRNDLCGRRP